MSVLWHTALRLKPSRRRSRMPRCSPVAGSGNSDSTRAPTRLGTLEICALHLQMFLRTFAMPFRTTAVGTSTTACFGLASSPAEAAPPMAISPQQSMRRLALSMSSRQPSAAAAATRFGSGWAWLCKCDQGVCVCSTPNQDNPRMQTDGCCTPLLCLDVWEHAYYLNYQNRRPDYIEAFWNVVDWASVAERYATAHSKGECDSCCS